MCWDQGVVSKKQSLPLRHVQQTDYSKTADKHARLSPKVQVMVVRPRVNFQGVYILAATSKAGSSSVMFNSPTLLGNSVM